MKGKIAFVIGAAVGYVLGSRAGRERYEQIKRGAATVWQTEPVQRGVTLVRDALDERADSVRAFVRRASSDVFSNLAKQTADKPRSAGRPTAAAEQEEADGSSAAEAPKEAKE
ncbi:MAG: YtxH domain-containing protein [Leucobacter sp.]|jgi:hypothetical protein|nr:YtxH domain-containing protein [Leucobacter sp.]